MWKQIEDLDYEICPEGIVRRISTKRVKKSCLRKDGYYGIQLVKKTGVLLNFQLHRLIAIAFIENPENKPFINHINSNRADYSISNLEWVTHSENVKHGYEKGFASNKGTKNGFSKLKDTDILEIRELKKTTNLSFKEIGKRFNVTHGCISGILSGSNWKHIQ